MLLFCYHLFEMPSTSFRMTAQSFSSSFPNSRKTAILKSYISLSVSVNTLPRMEAIFSSSDKSSNISPVPFLSQSSLILNSRQMDLHICSVTLFFPFSIRLIVIFVTPTRSPNCSSVKLSVFRKVLIRSFYFSFLTKLANHAQKGVVSIYKTNSYLLIAFSDGVSASIKAGRENRRSPYFKMPAAELSN